MQLVLNKTENGNIPISDRDILLAFIDTKYYDIVMGGFSNEPRTLIKEWVHENYNLSENDLEDITTHIGTRI